VQSVYSSVSLLYRNKYLDIFNVHMEEKPHIEDYDPDLEESAFLTSGNGVFFRAKAKASGGTKPVLSSEAERFGKWIKQQHKEVQISIQKAPTLSLHSQEFWMPFVILASDYSIQVYLGLVTSYIYDRLKGSLKQDRHTVHLSVVYQEASGKFKRFEYKGSVEGLKACVKPVDINKILNSD